VVNTSSFPKDLFSFSVDVQLMNLPEFNQFLARFGISLHSASFFFISLSPADSVNTYASSRGGKRAPSPCFLSRVDFTVGGYRLGI
jgi:hypothetical protein